MRRKKVVTKDGLNELSHYGGRRVVLSVARPHCVAYGWCPYVSKVSPGISLPVCALPELQGDVSGR